MANANSFMNNINIQIRSQWLQMIATDLTSPRITDYAKPMADMFAFYDPSLFSSDQNRTIQQWMIRAQNFLETQSFGPTALYPTSNWQAYRLWILAIIARTLKQPIKIQYYRSQFVDYLRKTISTIDGSLEDFTARDSLEYHIYCLYAIIKIVKTLGPSFQQSLAEGQLWDSQQQTYMALIKPAIDFVMPFLIGRKVHIEFVKSVQASDKTRASYNKPFDPNRGLYLLRELWSDA